MKKAKKLLAMLLAVLCITGTSVPALSALEIAAPLTTQAATNTDTSGSGGGSSGSELKDGFRSVGKQKEKVKKGDNKKNVWISKTSGTKYHKKDCRTLKKSKKQKVKLDKAKKHGFTRCKVCTP